MGCSQVAIIIIIMKNWVIYDNDKLNVSVHNIGTMKVKRIITE